MSNRGLALEWWRSLPYKEAVELALKYKSNWTFAMVSTSSSTIEFIFNSEK